MIVDDVCGVDLVDGALTVLPGYPRTRVWADTAKKLDIDTEPLQRTRPAIEKYERQVPASFHGSSVGFEALYILSVRNEPGIEIERIAPLDAFSAVLANTYRRTFLDGLAMRDDHFHVASAVATSVPVLRVRRPQIGFELAELADAIEADIAQRATTAES